MNENIQSDSKSWLLFVKVSFATALLATGSGIVFSDIDFMMKGYFALSALFLVSTSITLSKTMRDVHESERLINKISEARTQQLMKEYAE